ncbi:hypothetical protein, partial [Vibrio parahaemolyticus]|uniref:hypothetical protein n=1 Tax=Vibrio parahaemolyticus TaxID=670 RepID=UPI00226BAFAB
ERAAGIEKGRPKTIYFMLPYTLRFRNFKALRIMLLSLVSHFLKKSSANYSSKFSHCNKK